MVMHYKTAFLLTQTVIMKKSITTLCFLFCAFIAVSQTSTYPQGLNAGDKAPGFALKNESGKLITLDELLKTGQVVLVFYRGQWCPYCNKHLSRLNDSLQLIKDKGANVVAVTPEVQENISKTIKKTKATFPLLFDDGMKVMQAYKVNYKVDDKTVEKYKGYGIDFNTANGTNGENLPVPATYIIGKDGIIKQVFFNTDYTKRPWVKQILDNL
jgi:peroxiredoxin